MPRCMTRASPSSRSASRYLARRPSACHRAGRSAARQSRWETGSAGRRACAPTARIVAPSMTGSSPAADRFDLGKLGHRLAFQGRGVGDSPSAPARALWSGADARQIPAMIRAADPFRLPRACRSDEKQARVDDVFSIGGAPLRPDERPDVGGLHRVWKEAMVDWLTPQRRAFALLDVAGGTGDIAFRVADRAATARARSSSTSIARCSPVGRERAPGARACRQRRFVEGNAEALPFADSRFDAIPSPSASAT